MAYKFSRLKEKNKKKREYIYTIESVVVFFVISSDLTVTYTVAKITVPPFLIKSYSSLFVFSADYLPDYWQTCLVSLSSATSRRATRTLCPMSEYLNVQHPSFNDFCVINDCRITLWLLQDPDTFMPIVNPVCASPWTPLAYIPNSATTAFTLRARLQGIIHGIVGRLRAAFTVPRMSQLVAGDATAAAIMTKPKYSTLYDIFLYTLGRVR